MTKVASYLQALGVNPRMEYFTERKRLQKLGYLLKSFGLDIPFDFSWYIHGPYSPGLTRLLYETVEGGIVETEPLSGQENERVNRLKAFLGKDLTDSDKLELLASVHYLREIARNVGAPADEILLFLKEKKPYFTEQEVQECWIKSVELDKLDQR